MYLGNGSVGTQIIVRPDNTIIMEDFEIEKPGCGEVLIETVIGRTRELFSSFQTVG